MSKAEDFIVEIGTEELPPRELSNLVASFAESLQQQLTAAGIQYGVVATYVTPRRLAVYITDLAATQPDQKIAKRGPAVSAAFSTDGTPTKAAEGFASSCGTTFAKLGRIKNEKDVECLYFETMQTGGKTVDLIPVMIEQALKQLPVKKAMRWGHGELSFVRPIHWILMLYGKTVINANIFGLQSDNLTYGHRVHAPKAIRVTTADQYVNKLEKDGKVVVDFANRKEAIRQQIMELAEQQKAIPVIDPELLNLVTGLVEHPVALLANFEPEFLRVPKECLISAMQDHQKCFALLDQEQKLLPKFIVISNLSSTDPKTVIKGNELVMGARLADAAFHYDQDQQQTLASRVDRLRNIIYQQQLGSLYDKASRISVIAEFIAPKLNADPAIIKRAALLCKADLITNMVYEFPELQGIMGCYYALHDKEPAAVATAILEHYQPKFAQDELPKSSSGMALAIADRVDSLVGLFGIGKIPTGDKDPYALRRQALAVLRILIEREITLDLRELFGFAVQLYQTKIKDPTAELLEFCFDRLKAWYTSADVPVKVFAAVMANNPTDPLDFHRRIQAVIQFQALPAAANLAAANKRVHNILQKSLPSNAAHPVDQKLLVMLEEKDLYDAIQTKSTEIAPLLKSADYSAILQTLASLQKPVDNFFDHVMVNAEDEKLRNNRLQLLLNLRNLFLQVADVSLL